MNPKLFFDSRQGVYNILHIVILLLSLYLVISISIDTFDNISFYSQPRFLRTQLWICLAFLADYFIELFLSENKKRYVWTHMIFLLVSIPYLNVINYFGWHFSAEVTYFIQFIPLIRGGYALAIVVGWFTSNRTASLMLTYLLVLLASVYFCAMVFYVVEHNVNPLVENFNDALWWAAMDTTTVGSNITAVTPIGRILSVALACLGMMMLPMFTVYLSSLIQRSDPLMKASRPKKETASEKEPAQSKKPGRQ